MQLRKNLRDRVGELKARVEKSESEAFDRVFHERMDTYFVQQERLEEMAQLLEQITAEIDCATVFDGLRRLADRMNHLEDHFEEIDSRLYDRPMRRRSGRFNLFEFLRQATGNFSPGARDEINNEAEAFEELGMAQGSSLKSVTTAFRRRVKDLHPDRRGGDRSAEPKLRRLVAAYEFIKKKASIR